MSLSVHQKLSLSGVRIAADERRTPTGTDDHALAQNFIPGVDRDGLINGLTKAALTKAAPAGSQAPAVQDQTTAGGVKNALTKAGLTKASPAGSQAPTVQNQSTANGRTNALTKAALTKARGTQ